MERRPFPGPGARRRRPTGAAPRARPLGAVRAPLLAVGAARSSRSTAGVLAPTHRRPPLPAARRRRPRWSEGRGQQLSRDRRAGAAGRADRRRPAAGGRRGRRQGRCCAQAALAKYEPQMRAIAQSGYTGKTQSRVAAFLTSDSATELVAADDDAGHDRRAHRTRSSPRSPQPRTPPARPRPPPTRPPRRRRAGLAELQGAAGRGPEAGRRLPGRLRPALRRRAGRRDHGASPAASCAPPHNLPLAPGQRGREAIKTALAQVGDPYAARRHRPRRASTAPGLTSFAYAAAGIVAAALQPGAVQLGTPGVARRAPARRPRLLLHADQPRRPLHRRRDDGARPHLRLAGRGHQRRPARLPVRRPPRLQLIPPAQWMRRPSASICTQVGDPLGARRAGVVAVCTRQRTAYRLAPSSASNSRRAGGLGGQRGREVVGHGDRRRARVGALPAAVGPRRLDGGEPAPAASGRRESAPRPRRRSSATRCSSAGAASCAAGRSGRRAGWTRPSIQPKHSSDSTSSA